MSLLTSNVQKMRIMDAKLTLFRPDGSYSITVERIIQIIELCFPIAVLFVFYSYSNSLDYD